MTEHELFADALGPRSKEVVRSFMLLSSTRRPATSWNFRRPLARIVACALLLGGCYTSSTVGESASGTRLRRVIIRPAGGEPTLAGWYDVELEADCAFVRAEDGRTRCLPISAGSFYFQDSACASPVLVAADDGCDDARFAQTLGPPSGCGEMPVSTLQYEVDRALIAVDRAFVVRSGECVAADVALPRAHRLMRMDPARFVAGEWTRGEDTGAPILRGRFVAEDGATVAGGLWDRARDAPCSLPYSSLAGPQPCLPWPYARTRRGGASCDEVWALGDAGCPPHELAYSAETDECNIASSFHVHAIEEALEGSERVLGDACRYSDRASAVYRTRPADDEVPWVSQSFRGESRLQAAVWSDEEGNELFRTWWGYYDSELGGQCYVAQTMDGLRCVPGAEPFNAYPRLATDTYFADDRCTAPAVLPVGACLPPFFISEAPPLDGCSGFGRIDGAYRVEGTLERVYHRDASGACVIDDTIGADLAHQVTRIPLDAMVRVERTIE